MNESTSVSGNGVCLSIWAPLGTMKVVCFTGNFERKMRFSFIRRPRLLGTLGEM